MPIRLIDCGVTYIELVDFFLSSFFLSSFSLRRLGSSMTNHHHTVTRNGVMKNGDGDVNFEAI